MASQLPAEARKDRGLGFVAPRILRRVNDARNLLEHEYRAPAEDKVAEAIDLATLFVEAGNRHISMFEHEFSLANREDVIDTFHAKKELSIAYHQEASSYFPTPFSFRVAGWMNSDGSERLDQRGVVGCVTVPTTRPSFRRWYGSSSQGTNGSESSVRFTSSSMSQLVPAEPNPRMQPGFNESVAHASWSIEVVKRLLTPS